MVDKLIEFARKHHPGFEGMPEKTLRALFETYKKTTLVWYEKVECPDPFGGGPIDREVIKGFAIYQEWPDRLNFIAIAGIGGRAENLKAILRGREQLPRKMICWFDETKMELKTLCRP